MVEFKIGDEVTLEKGTQYYCQIEEGWQGKTGTIVHFSPGWASVKSGKFQDGYPLNDLVLVKRNKPCLKDLIDI